MSPGEIVDLLLLRINGGVLNAESAVWRVDLLAYLPGAINYVLTKQENIQIQEEGDREMPGEFIANYNLPIEKDAAGFFITLPVLPIKFRSNRGIRFVIDNCLNAYAPLRETSVAGLKRLLPMLGDKALYWYKGSKRIDLLNKPKLADNVNAYIMRDISDYAIDEELPIPAGLEPEVINIMYEFYTGQRQAPADRKTDERDLN